MVIPLLDARRLLAMAAVAASVLLSSHAFAQQGAVLTVLENEVVTAARGWQTTVMNAARSLFWILAGIEIAIAAVWLAINAVSLDAWFAELVRRIMFVGLFAFILDQGPDFARAIVDSLFQIGASSGSASPANIFDAGIRVASKMSEQARFGLFEDNALAIAAVFAMVVVVVCFSLVAAIFIAVLVEMYVGLLAGMIMLGLGGSSFTKDFAIRYLVYAFSVGLKLMALVMIARIGAEVLLGLAETDPTTADSFVTTLAIAGIAVVVFIIAMYVPSILQGVVQGVSITTGMEAIRHGAQAMTFSAGAAFLGVGATERGVSAASNARAGGSSVPAAVWRGMASGIGSAVSAAGSAAKDKAIATPGAHAGSLLGLANAKLDQDSPSRRSPSRSEPLKHNQ